MVSYSVVAITHLFMIIFSATASLYARGFFGFFGFFSRLILSCDIPFARAMSVFFSKAVN